MDHKTRKTEPSNDAAAPEPKRRCVAFADEPEVVEFEKIDGERGLYLCPELMKSINKLKTNGLGSKEIFVSPTEVRNLFGSEEEAPGWEWEEDTTSTEGVLFARQSRAAQRLGGFTAEDLQADVDLAKIQSETAEAGLMPFNLKDVYEDGDIDKDGNFSFHQRDTEENKLNKDPWVKAVGEMTRDQLQATATAHAKQQERIRREAEKGDTSLGSLILLVEAQNIVKSDYLESIVDFRRSRAQNVIRPLIRESENVVMAMQRIKKEDQTEETPVNSRAKGKGKPRPKSKRLSKAAQNTMDLITELCTDGLSLIDDVYTLPRKILYTKTLELIPTDKRSDLSSIPLPKEDTPIDEPKDVSDDEFTAKSFATDAA